MALKYCNGSPRQSETVFGWSRETVALGVAEKRSGLTSVATALFCLEFPSLSWLDETPEAVLKGICTVVSDCIEDMTASGDPIPAPLSTKT